MSEKCELRLKQLHGLTQAMLWAAKDHGGFGSCYLVVEQEILDAYQKRKQEILEKYSR